MKKIYVMGHKIPDTDCTLASIIYSKFLSDTGKNTEAVKLGELNNETKYILKLIGEKIPKTVNSLEEGTEIILVDHNDRSQTIDNIEDLYINELIDHHNFGNFTTKKPIKARWEPLCSSWSIIYKILKEEGYKIDKKIATMLIAAIISDSLFFRSPTTTKQDMKLTEEINLIAGIENLEEFAINMFAAKSDLGDITAEEIVKSDYKEFSINGKKAGVGCLETTNPAYALDKEDIIVEALKKIKKESKLDFIMLSIVDIFNEKNITLACDNNDKEIISKIFNKKFEGNKVNLGRILSRKKQIIPVLNENL